MLEMHSRHHTAVAWGNGCYVNYSCTGFEARRLGGALPLTSPGITVFEMQPLDCALYGGGCGLGPVEEVLLHGRVDLVTLLAGSD